MVMPARLQAAFTAQAALNQQGIWFAPIRHHSPACAYAVRHLIQHIQPSHILIEAPQSFQPLLPDLLSPDTVPPIAIFAQAKGQTTHSTDSPIAPPIHSAYFPFCDYSPEWVALRTGSAQHAHVQFIDLDWASQCQLQAQPVGQAQVRVHFPVTCPNRLQRPLHREATPAARQRRFGAVRWVAAVPWRQLDLDRQEDN